MFTRHFGIAGDPSKREIEQRLWALADTQVDVAPDLDMAASGPDGPGRHHARQAGCDKCPVADTCVARREGRQAELHAKARKAVPERETAMLVLQCNGAYLLQQRPEPGIWGGLWSLPEFDATGDPGAASRELGLEPERHSALAAFSHTFLPAAYPAVVGGSALGRAARAARRRAGCRPMNWQPPRCRRR